MSLLDDIKKLEDESTSAFNDDNDTNKKEDNIVPIVEYTPTNTILFRPIKDSKSSTIIAIGLDEDQSGKEYNNGEGVWCDFTISQMPEITLTQDIEMLLNEFNQWLQCSSPYKQYLDVNEYNFMMFRVLNNKVAIKTETQIKTMIDEAKSIISEVYKDYTPTTMVENNEESTNNTSNDNTISNNDNKQQPISIFDAMKPVE